MMASTSAGAAATSASYESSASSIRPAAARASCWENCRWYGVVAPEGSTIPPTPFPIRRAKNIEP